MTHSVDEVVGEAEKAALVTIDHVLAAPKDDASEKKIFNELEGVDKAVTTACSGVIRALLQVCLCYADICGVRLFCPALDRSTKQVSGRPAVVK